jgi:hypothetical protein
MDLKACDIVLTRSETLVGRLIRYFSQSPGEPESQVNHVGVMVTPTLIVEAVSKVVRRPLIDAYGPKSKQKLAVYRPLFLSGPDEVKVVLKANSYVGRKYGYLKLAAHLADWCLGGAYVFRRLCGIERYPMCSWLDAHVFREVGETFGVEENACEPDDIWDWVTAHPERYGCVKQLGPWEQRGTEWQRG